MSARLGNARSRIGKLTKGETRRGLEDGRKENKEDLEGGA